MNGHYVHNKRLRKVGYHYAPPQKVAITAFERNRAFVIGIVVLFAVFALSFSSFFSTNLVGFATVATPLPESYGISVNPVGNTIEVKLDVKEKKVSSIYLELLYVSEDTKTHLCNLVGNSNIANLVKADTSLNLDNKDKGWNKEFRDVTCTNQLVFSDGTLDADLGKTKEFTVFKFPNTGLPATGSFKLYIPKLDVYDFATGKDLFYSEPFEFMISLENGQCKDGTCGLGENKENCPADCLKETKAVCGNSNCESGETKDNCAKDCDTGSKGVAEIGTTKCGDGKCEGSETNANCGADCASPDKGSSSGGGGGGGGGGCIPQWSCGNWGLCNNTKQQSRTCNDIGKQCVNKKPKIENQSCVCSESWECSAWSGCVMGKNTRMCTDGRKCGTVASKPVESKGCQEVVPEYVPPPQQTYQPPMQQQYQPLQVTPPVVQKPEPTVWEKYKEWIVGLPMLLLFITILIITVLHFTKKQPQVTFNYDELKDWIKKERDAGTTDMDIELILAQNTGWTKEEVEKIFSEMAAGQKVEMPKVAS